MKLYRPSNGTEGECFICRFCENCIHGKYEHTHKDEDNPCDILSASLAFDTSDPNYPKQWIYDDDNKPICTEWVKWDWKKDDDGNWNYPSKPEPEDPMQLCLPFIFQEIETKTLILQKS